MACACKVNRDITYLQKRYGEKQPESKKTNLKEKVRLFFRIIFFGSILCLFIPFMVLHILFNRNKKIDIAKLFRLKNTQNVRSKQVI